MFFGMSLKLNSISTHMLTKFYFISLHLCPQFDIIFLSETCLNSEMPSDNKYLKIHWIQPYQGRSPI